MKMRSLLVAALAAAALLPAGTAFAQKLPDMPGIGLARDQIGAAGTARTRTPAEGLPGSGVIPDLKAAPTRGGSPSRLPATGVNTGSLALDGLTLLGAGMLLLAVRRRLSHSS